MVKGLEISIMSYLQCLFESATNSELTQVIIPFESSADPKSVKEHVMSTVSRVVAKVSLFPPAVNSRPVFMNHFEKKKQVCFCLESFLHLVNSLPHDKFLDWYKLKAFPDNKISVT